MTSWKTFLFGDNRARQQNETEGKMWKLFIAIAIVLFIVAIVFANGSYRDLVSALTVLSFALAGAVSLIAAAIVKEKS
jgi:hypothetical protein